ncbi:MAG: PHP domain-containing protein [Cytophagales bacterium]|nr:PHP domain-containing protein [Cytophagales bacterium]MDW8383213.1 PHP domain-containing protein [Flammeovirgaceae bacterium]
MKHKDIIRKFELLIFLLELHNVEETKIKLFSEALLKIEQLPFSLDTCKSVEEIEQIGFSKSIATTIFQMITKNEFPFLEELVSQTPQGVIKMKQVSGLGIKKIRTLWKEAKIDSLEALEMACKTGIIARLKGFGEKSQAQILESVRFVIKNSCRLRLSDADIYIKILQEFIENVQQEAGKSPRTAIVGETARSCEVVESLDLVVGYPFLYDHYKNAIQKSKVFILSLPFSNPFILRGSVHETQTPFQIILCEEKNWINTVFRYTAAAEHLTSEIKDGKSLIQIIRSHSFKSEEEVYQSVGLPYIIPERREFAPSFITKNYITYQDLKGVLHCHSTYSDGKNSLREMAIACKELGFEYLGITDHSVSAFYANGLSIESVFKQHHEIENLNKELAPFRILKGIESDILADGSLDYPDEILAMFDFVIASVHSGLKMDKQTATRRIGRALENPYTTILGHATGRLLLEREGYPLDVETIIDLALQNNVVIEINANPYRLDLDWRWAIKAAEKGVRLSINPDAHRIEGYHDIHYGVRIARKAGLTPSDILNTLSLEEVCSFFAQRKLAKNLLKT